MNFELFKIFVVSAVFFALAAVFATIGFIREIEHNKRFMTIAIWLVILFIAILLIVLMAVLAFKFKSIS